MIFDSLRGSLRARALNSVNARAAKSFTRTLPGTQMPSYIVVTPHVTHLAPLAAENHSDSVQPIFVINGLADDDIAWLGEIAPTVPSVRLRASLTGNADSLLAHGVVIDTIAAASAAPFCIQDADCFVVDAKFWDSVHLDVGREYAAGPFIRQGDTEGRPEFPETFLLCLNAQLMNRLLTQHGITSRTATKPGLRASRKLAAAGYPQGRYLETLKDYYDTLQQYWVASVHEGYRFNRIAGEGDTVHHIGGTSYLYNDFGDLEHWDYWSLNVQYFHLRLIETPACRRFAGRFARLTSFHHDADTLLEAYPGFAAGWRRRESDLILKRMGAEALYG